MRVEKRTLRFPRRPRERLECSHRVYPLLNFFRESAHIVEMEHRRHDNSRYLNALVHAAGWMVAVLALIVFSSGCLTRSRLNATCEWVDDLPRTLNLDFAPDMDHLVSDVELAEELGIRYGDSFRRHYGRSVEATRRTECQNRLLGEIADLHQVSSAQVRESRRARPAFVDLAVLLAFGVVYCFVAAAVIRVTIARVGLERRMVLLAGIAIGAAGLSGAGLASFNLLWVPIVEIIRTGNTHRSSRAAVLPWGAHLLELLVLGILLFGALACFQAWRANRKAGS